MRTRRRFTSLLLILVFLLSACEDDLPVPPPVEVTATSTTEVQLTPIDLPLEQLIANFPQGFPCLLILSQRHPGCPANTRLAYFAQFL